MTSAPFIEQRFAFSEQRVTSEADDPWKHALAQRLHDLQRDNLRLASQFELLEERLDRQESSLRPPV